MNRPILRLALALGCPAAACADYSFDAAIRYGFVDTGLSTQHLASPEFSVYRAFGESGTQAIGFTYATFKWSDDSVLKTPPPPGGADFVYEIDRSGSVRWNVFFLGYRHSIPISKSWTLVLSPRLGAAKGSESGTVTSLGGITGIMVLPYTADSAWRLAAEAQACLKWQIAEGWHSQFGVAFTHLQNRNSNLPLAKSISSIQGVLGVSYSF